MLFSSKPKTTVESGKRGEDFVCARLVERNFSILNRNVREKFAEIDIVAMDDKTLCFIEVRTRTNALLGHPAETVTAKKQHNIRRAAESYLAKKNIPPMPMRFDVATIIWDSMQFEYFENAF